MSGAIHVTPEDLEALHQESTGGGSKGCLTRHQPRTPDHHCSHQWQAGEKAKADKDMYKVRGMPHWNVDYSGESNIPGKKNFEHFEAPYWHNAHHIIPNGSLKSAIATEGRKKKGILRLIKQSLLRAEYNLNDKVNMIILPMEREVGVLLHLPRHLKRGDIGPGEQGEYFSHEAYSDEAQEKLKPIIADYGKIAAKALEKADKNHDKPDMKVSKKKITDLSTNIYNAIKAAGKAGPGKALSNLCNEIFGSI